MRSDSFHRQNVQRSAALSWKWELCVCVFLPLIEVRLYLQYIPYLEPSLCGYSDILV
jgi:hypothetical protein